MFEFQIEDSGKYGELTLEGEICIQRANELKTALIRALDSFDDVVLNIERVTDVDISCLQLLCSAHRTAIGLKKSITCSNEPSQVFNQVLVNSGLNRLNGCFPDQNKNCLWIKGE